MKSSTTRERRCCVTASRESRRDTLRAILSGPAWTRIEGKMLLVFDHQIRETRRTKHLTNGPQESLDKQKQHFLKITKRIPSSHNNTHLFSIDIDRTIMFISVEKNHTVLRSQSLSTVFLSTSRDGNPERPSSGRHVPRFPTETNSSLRHPIRASRAA